MPTKTKPKAKVSKKAKNSPEIFHKTEVWHNKTAILESLVEDYESATGAKAAHTTVLNFLNWWREQSNPLHR